MVKKGVRALSALGWTKVSNIAGGNVFKSKKQAQQERQMMRYSNILSNASVRIVQVAAGWIIMRKEK